MKKLPLIFFMFSLIAFFGLSLFTTQKEVPIAYSVEMARPEPAPAPPPPLDSIIVMKREQGEAVNSYKEFAEKAYTSSPAAPSSSPTKGPEATPPPPESPKFEPAAIDKVAPEALKLYVQAALSILTFIISIIIILAKNRFTADEQKWAYSTIALILGYWIK